jgi:ABC-type Fe3+ transport system substrate-binding protein
MTYYHHLVAFAVLATGLSAFQLPARGDDLYELAAREGEVSYYAQGPRQVYADLVAQFEARYPKVKVRVTPGRYDVIEKINGQMAKPEGLDADVVTAQTVQDLVKWSRAGALMRVDFQDVETIPSHLRGKDFLPLSLYLIGGAYNADTIAAAESPKAIDDFLKPQFHQKIVSTFPHDDDVTLYLYDQIRRKYGWSFFSKLMEQKPQFVRSHVLVADAVKTGSRPVTFDQISSFNASQFVVPSDVPMVVFPYGIAAFAKAKHPNAAKLFIAFSLSKDQQDRFVKRNVWSARTDVTPPDGFKPIADYHVASDFIEFISDGRNAESLRKQFEQIIGPVAGDYISTAPAAPK